MGGEAVTESEVLPQFGLPGDRGWAVRDDTALEIRSAKCLASLLMCRARYLSEPVGAATPEVSIELPDGRSVRSSDTDVDASLSSALGRPVSLWSRRPADDREHYRRRDPIDEAEMRRQYGLEDGERLPDPSQIDPGTLATLLEFVSPLGTYFDAFEVHLLTTASLGRLASLNPLSVLDARRFRPNIVVELDPWQPGFPEFGWVGRHLHIGSCVLAVKMPMQRCVMTTLEQPGLSADRSIIKAIAREAGHNLGVGLSVIEAGSITCGDPVELE